MSFKTGDWVVFDCNAPLKPSDSRVYRIIDPSPPGYRDMVQIEEFGTGITSHTWDRWIVKATEGQIATQVAVRINGRLCSMCGGTGRTTLTGFCLACNGTGHRRM